MLNDVALFVQIVRAGSFSQASQRLGIPASTLSRRVSALERQLGGPLLMRSTRTLSCTPAGELLYKLSSSNIDNFLVAIETMLSVGNEISGKVRIQVPVGFFECWSNGFFAEVLDFYPKLELQVFVSDHEPDLDKENIDLLLMMGGPKRKHCVAQKLCALRLGFYASEEYLRIQGTPAIPEDLRDHQCINRTGEKFANIMLPHSEIFLPVQISSRFSTNSMTGLINAAEQGLGIALINEHCVNLDFRKIVRVLPQYLAYGESLYAVHSNHKMLSAREKAVLDYTVARMTALGLSKSAATL